MRKSEKVLYLIMPPQAGLLGGFASGLISLANYVQLHLPEVDVHLLDLSEHSSEKAKKRISQISSGMQSGLFFGITATTASYQPAIHLARHVKAIFPTAAVVLGGHHPSADFRTILKYHPDIVDVIAIGEGERTLIELLRHYPDLVDVPGVAFLDKSGRIVLNKAPAHLTQEELDSIPVMFGEFGLVGTPGKFGRATYVSARGCPLRCAFCAVGNDPIRSKSIPAVVRDLETLLDHGFSQIAIEDNFFAHSSRRTKELCQALAAIRRRRGDSFVWDCQTRVESLMKNEIISLMAQAGCEAVYIGMESANPEHLAYLRKARDPQGYIECLERQVVPAVLGTNMECYLTLQLGFIGESRVHASRTLSFLKRLGTQAMMRGKRVTVFPQLHVVYPGTAHYRKGVAERRFPADIFESFTRWEYRQPRVLRWLGEHFAHGAGGVPEGIIRPDVLSEAQFDDPDKVVDTQAIMQINATLRAIDRLPGIATYDYGDYISA